LMEISIQTSNTMAYPTINAAVSKLILEAKMQVIDDFIKMLDEKIEIDNDLQGQFDEFKKSLEEASKAASKASKTTSKEPKKKRSATLFNLFVKEKQAQLKAEHPEENGKAIIGMASKSWKEDPFALYIKEHTDNIKKENADADNVTLYKMLKELYESDSEVTKPATKAATTTDSENSDEDTKDAKDTKSIAKKSKFGKGKKK
jgi:hypothetical protein